MRNGLGFWGAVYQKLRQNLPGFQKGQVLISWTRKGVWGAGAQIRFSGLLINCGPVWLPRSSRPALSSRF